ncbi:MAG: phosphoribosylformylglycinamidine synthase [Planctomycetes bacterium]|nr:phosphoribosylformylglycinamidine synthase [Planctomycetota bacterium]NOG55381.1 phosphoribosylformylglycinamidine synthase [Planctomycetota bacterium]
MPIHRIEVHCQDEALDSRGAGIARSAQDVLGISSSSSLSVRSADVYLIEADLTDEQMQTLADGLLADPVTQCAVIGARDEVSGESLIEVHPLPGVMDPVAESVELSIRELIGIEARVRSGTRYGISGVTNAQARALADRLLSNSVIHAVYEHAHCPESFPVGSAADHAIREVPLRDLDDAGLLKLSRSAHLFLSVDEMRTIRDYYAQQGREPRDIELETLAQTWSEHCVHKTLKSTIEYEGVPLPVMSPAVGSGQRPGVEVVDANSGRVVIHNLLKSTVAAATHELMADETNGVDWCLSVFVDNAGVVAFDDEAAICFKVETHNHPSAIEPYGGAATGIGGCIRDVIGTGLAARPIASTDVFCVADPSSSEDDVPAGCLAPRRILTQVVAGVRDYGNRMGIPTVNGAVRFDSRYVGNPLVYCGCIGIMPRDKVHGDPQAGDHIIVLGGATGRDGIHGATFSSAELTDTHADEFGHAVQIGNPITEKKTLDAIMQARDYGDGHGCLFSAITDCGAGGYSSAVGEMGEMLGAEVFLERAPLKYDGLSYTEIWISEAQERMVLSVPAENLEALAEICRVEDVPWCDLGTFGTADRELILNFHDQEVGRLDMGLLHEGIPTPVRKARWDGPAVGAGHRGDERDSSADVMKWLRDEADVGQVLLGLLRDPNVASKHWIIRQYDHEVQGQTVVKPLVGGTRVGPSDAAVMLPRPGHSMRGLAIANGLTSATGNDPYYTTLAAIDECVRNLVCVGADPDRIAILDNFCWPSCDKPENLGSLVRAAVACYDGAKAYRTPFVSGKDSLNNQFTTEDGQTIEIPPTLLISGMGIVHDVTHCVTMDAKQAGSLLIAVGMTRGGELGGSLVLEHMPGGTHGVMADPVTDLEVGPATARAVAALIRQGLVLSAHDCSEGGLLVAAAEMVIGADGSGIGLNMDRVGMMPTSGNTPLAAQLFAETPCRYLLEVAVEDKEAARRCLRDYDGVEWAVIGTFDDSGALKCEKAGGLEVGAGELVKAWRGTLDW